MRHIILFLSFFVVVITNHAQNSLKTGIWRGMLILDISDATMNLPFNFNLTYIKNKPVIEIYNAEEKIKVEESEYIGDSLVFRMPVFDTRLIVHANSDTLKGFWVNDAKKEKNKVSFIAYAGETRRFITKKTSALNFTGRYEVTFEKGTKDEYKAIGLFTQKGNKVSGTFLTETGDYRYLDGVVEENTMRVSCFDGAHAFLFFASSSKKTGNADSLAGLFKGFGFSEQWIATRNDTFQLKNPESITYLKNPNEVIAFSFPNLNKQTIQLTDAKFKNKAVIIQIMGSWCPNCMDETAYLSQLYKQYKSKDLEIIALAYERTPDFEKAKNNVLRLKSRFSAEYEFLITGLTGKAKASESLPFLSSISAFPTTIILNKNHHVESIYTGFSGPATGKEYDEYKRKMELMLKKILN